MIYDYEYFKKEIYSLTTIDLNAYKEKQMKRRIDTLIAKHKIVGYDTTRFTPNGSIRRWTFCNK